MNLNHFVFKWYSADLDVVIELADMILIYLIYYNILTDYIQFDIVDAFFSKIYYFNLRITNLAKSYQNISTSLSASYEVVCSASLMPSAVSSCERAVRPAGAAALLVTLRFLSPL